MFIGDEDTPLCDIHKSNQIESNSQLKKNKTSTDIELCDIHKSNQIESNSQRNIYISPAFYCCVISTKVIKLKAIHNGLEPLPFTI